MKLRNAFLPLAALALAAACGDNTSSGVQDRAPSAGGTFRVEITGADTRTITNANGRVSVSMMESDDPPWIGFRLTEPTGEGSTLYQLLLGTTDLEPGAYMIEGDDSGNNANYTILVLDAAGAMVSGEGRTFGQNNYSGDMSGTITISARQGDIIDGNFDVTIEEMSVPPPRTSIRAAGEFSGVTIPRRR